MVALVAILATPTFADHPGENLDTRMIEMESDFHVIDTLAPAFNLQDAEGKLVRLSDFIDKIVLLNFTYSNCTDMCQLHSKKISEIQASINDGHMKDLVQFISVTTVPMSDIPPTITNYEKIYGLDPVNSVYLTHTADQPVSAIHQLARDYGHGFTNSDNGTIINDIAAIHVIDIEGRLAGAFHSVNFNNVNLILYVNELTNIAQHRMGK
jgi:protein SCO1/2